MEETALTAAIRGEMEKVLKGETFGLPELARIQKLAKAGQQMLLAVGVEGAPTLLSDDEMTPSYGGSINSLGSVAFGGYGNAETFGAKMIKEVIELLPDLMRQKNESPERLVSAIAEAEERGMKDVSASLRKKLLGTVSEPALEVGGPIGGVTVEGKGVVTQ